MRKIAVGRCYDDPFINLRNLESRNLILPSLIYPVWIRAIRFAHSSKGGYSTHGDRGPQHFYYD